MSKPVGPRKIKVVRGICNIISNSFENNNCECHTHLPYKSDVENIFNTFEWLNFNVNEPLLERRSDEIRQDIREMAKEDFDGVDCFALFLLSHGSVDDLLQGTDCQDVSIDKDIIDKIVNCNELNGIPKLFFIQACRGETDMDAFKMKNEQGNFDTAAVPEGFKAKRADTFVFNATPKGYSSWLDKKDGSFFIRNLCDVLQEFCVHDTLHLGDVAAEVNQRVSEHGGQDRAQVSEVKHTLTKNLYFHPVQPKQSYEEFLKSKN